ncbi:MAG: PIN domain-containing protein [Magnetococcus sp. YQC-3]
MRSILLDAGAMIALFAVDDKHHRRFDKLVKEQARTGLRLLTTWPCVVEACHILPAPQRFELLRWLELGGAQVYTFESFHLRDMVRWMRQYSELGKRRQMDLADASLYWLAIETGVTLVMTVDVADFTRYRLPDGRAFELL